MANTIQILKDGQPVYPITDVSLVIGLEDAIKLPPVKVTTLPTASAETAGKMYYVGPDANDEYGRYITSAVNGSYEWIDLGDTSIPLPSIADNLTTDDSNMALSAKQGVVLDGKLSQLGQEVNGGTEQQFVEQTLIEGYSFNTYLNPMSPSASAKTGACCVLLEVTEGEKYIISGTSGNAKGTKVYTTTDANRNVMRQASEIDNFRSNPLELTIAAGEKYLYVDLPEYDAQTDFVKKQVSVTTIGLVERVTELETVIEQQEQDLANQYDELLSYSSVIPSTELVEGKYATESSGRVTFVNVVGCNYHILPIPSFLVGKKVAVKTVTPSYPICLIFTDEEGVITRSTSGTEGEENGPNIYTIQTGEAYLYVNCDAGYTPFIGTNYEDFLKAEYKGANGIIENGRYASYNNSEKFSDVALAGYSYRKIDLRQYVGRKILVTTDTNSATYNVLWEIIAIDGTVVSKLKPTGKTSCQNSEIIVTNTMAFLYVNAKVVDDVPVSSVSVLVDTETLFDKITRTNINESIRGKSVCTFGDSITWYDGKAYLNGKAEGEYAVGYQSYMSASGMFVTNMGHSGATSQNICEDCLATDLSGFDFVTFTAGANDSRYQKNVGELLPVGSDFDTTTFIGAFQKMIEYALSQNPEVKIMLITPPRGWIYYPDGYASSAQSQVSGDGVVEKRYADAIKAVGNFYAIPVCDVYNECGFNLLTREVFINDNEPSDGNNLYSLHPSKKGYKRIADIIMAKIRTI